MNSTDQSTGYGRDVPPAQHHVEVYFIQKGLGIFQAHRFYERYSKRGWLRKDGFPIQDWKRLAWQWIWNGPVTRHSAGQI